MSIEASGKKMRTAWAAPARGRRDRRRSLARRAARLPGARPAIELA
ncbi:MAG: hypothetical protein ACOX6T_12645 [Myxococcales bacterium]